MQTKTGMQEVPYGMTKYNYRVGFNYELRYKQIRFKISSRKAENT